MNKLKELLFKFRALPGWQQDAAFFIVGFLCGAVFFWCPSKEYP